MLKVSLAPSKPQLYVYHRKYRKLDLALSFTIFFFCFKQEIGHIFIIEKNIKNMWSSTSFKILSFWLYMYFIELDQEKKMLHERNQGLNCGEDSSSWEKVRAKDISPEWCLWLFNVLGKCRIEYHTWLYPATKSHSRYLIHHMSQCIQSIHSTIFPFMVPTILIQR